MFQTVLPSLGTARLRLSPEVALRPASGGTVLSWPPALERGQSRDVCPEASHCFLPLSTAHPHRERTEECSGHGE